MNPIFKNIFFPVIKNCVLREFIKKKKKYFVELTYLTTEIALLNV